MIDEKHSAGDRSTPRWKEAIVLALTVSILVTALLILGPFHHGSLPDLAPSQSTPTSITLAVAPTHGADVLPGELRPIARYLETTLPLKVSLTRSINIKAALHALVERKVDGAVLPAIACVRASDSIPGLRFLAAQSFEDKFTVDSLLVVRRDERVKLSRLEEHRVCAAHGFSPSATLMMPLWMRSHGIEPGGAVDDLRWTGDPLDALGELIEGRCDIVATDETSLSAATSTGIDTSRLRILARTGHIPLSCWVSSPRLEERISHAISQALTDFDPMTVTGNPHVGEVLRLGRFRRADTTTYRGIKVASQLLSSR